MILEKELFIFDMDGVIYKLDHPILSGVQFIKYLQDHNKIIAFFTNNSSKTPEIYQKKLNKMGLEISVNQIYTSATIAGDYLAEKYSDIIFYVIGETGLIEVLKSKGFRILNQENPLIENKEFLAEDDFADVVIVGWDTQINFGKLRTALMLIFKGADFYATNEDASFPVPGTVWPGTGAIVAYLKTALGQSPLKVFGKPHKIGFQKILRDFQLTPEKSVMIGDRLSTDIFGGNNMGMTTICVETGVHTKNDESKFPISHHPTLFCKKLTDLLPK